MTAHRICTENCINSSLFLAAVICFVKVTAERKAAAGMITVAGPPELIPHAYFLDNAYKDRQINAPVLEIVIYFDVTREEGGIR